MVALLKNKYVESMAKTHAESIVMWHGKRVVHSTVNVFWLMNPPHESLKFAQVLNKQDRTGSIANGLLRFGSPVFLL
jgi:hypothetical protein